MPRPKKGVIPPQLRPFIKKKKKGSKKKTKKKKSSKKKSGDWF